MVLPSDPPIDICAGARLNLIPPSLEECHKHFTEPFERDKVVFGGTTGLVVRLPCGHVRKQPYPDDTPRGRENSLQEIKRECDIYGRIANTPHFLEMIEFSEQHGIILQGVEGHNLHHYLEDEDFCIPIAKRMEWARDMAIALHSLHAVNVIHADVKPENILLDEQSHKVYLVDFSGSWIDGRPGPTVENIRFFLPRDIMSDSTVQTDIFAFGSTLYEIMTSKQPYHDLNDEEVGELFKQGIFPSLDLVPCGQIIKKCWTGMFQSVQDVQAALQEVQGS
ncbi:kinase-like protein [Aureobasidium namibiae CBS 147.97]|uniref:Kinase-like protein n=1 Tax=Aureobasidium namibiae CBS 147.97 TaxID=1043004 RepID=A0A074WR00_9PEZI